MNELVSRMISGKQMREDVPLPSAALPTRSYRSRLDRLRKRRDPDGIEDEPVQDSAADTVRRILGEGDEAEEEARDMDGIFPDDNEEIGSRASTLTTPLRKIKDVVQEPSHPTGEKERLLTPYAALTAPDVTPQSMEPIDPSKVPGLEPSETFRAADLDVEGAVPNAEPTPQPPNALDMLLGRNRRSASPMAGPSSPPGSSPTPPPQPVMTEEAAQRMFSRGSSDPSTALEQGKPMPEHSASDGRNIMEAFRRAQRKP